MVWTAYDIQILPSKIEGDEMIQMWTASRLQIFQIQADPFRVIKKHKIIQSCYQRLKGSAS